MLPRKKQRTTSPSPLPVSTGATADGVDTLSNDNENASDDKTVRGRKVGWLGEMLEMPVDIIAEVSRCLL